MRRDKTREQAGKIRERTGRKNATASVECQRRKLIQVATGFEQWFTKNPSRFKKCFNFASTTDEHISFYLNYHSAGYLTMYYYVLLKGFSLSNSLKCTNSRYFLFADILSSEPLSPDIFTLKCWSISNSVQDNMFMLKQQHYTLTKVKKVKS